MKRRNVLRNDVKNAQLQEDQRVYQWKIYCSSIRGD
jgi:hypothetical protein